MSASIDPKLYEDLRGIAAAYMRGERAAHTLQTTALVHEAYLRIAKQSAPEPRDRGHLLGLAARAMRQILVEHARRRGAKKRGGEARRVTLPSLPTDDESPLDLLALDECLTELASLDDTKCRIVELLYFGGLNIPETAEALGMAQRTVEKHWSLALAWLRARLG